MSTAQLRRPKPRGSSRLSTGPETSPFSVPRSSLPSPESLHQSSRLPWRVASSFPNSQALCIRTRPSPLLFNRWPQRSSTKSWRGVRTSTTFLGGLASKFGFWLSYSILQLWGYHVQCSLRHTRMRRAKSKCPPTAREPSPALCSTTRSTKYTRDGEDPSRELRAEQVPSSTRGEIMKSAKHTSRKSEARNAPSPRGTGPQPHPKPLGHDGDGHHRQYKKAITPPTSPEGTLPLLRGITQAQREQGHLENHVRGPPSSPQVTALSASRMRACVRNHPLQQVQVQYPKRETRYLQVPIARRKSEIDLEEEGTCTHHHHATRLHLHARKCHCQLSIAIRFRYQGTVGKWAAECTVQSVAPPTR
mmetsp:Transcript_31261/g.90902  ORF Transcript_31261/g.90902 Transcript_31261/m.90902 type:complete len:361 (+) Transcript_31261:758-1840(+)